MCVFSIASNIEEIIRFRDYIFNFHGFVKCQEEDCDLKRFINKVDDTLKSQCLGNKKKKLFARVCVKVPTTFRCFFKLFSKKVTINVISDKDENFKQKIDTLKN